MNNEDLQTLKEFFDSFERVEEQITEIILLGKNGGIRRIVYSIDDEFEELNPYETR